MTFLREDTTTNVLPTRHQQKPFPQPKQTQLLSNSCHAKMFNISQNPSQTLFSPKTPNPNPNLSLLLFLFLQSSPYPPNPSISNLQITLQHLFSQMGFLQIGRFILLLPHRKFLQFLRFHLLRTTSSSNEV